MPGEGSEYARVLARFGEETPFRELVEAFASGLGLAVVRVLPTGIMLAGQPGSPFALVAMNGRFISDVTSVERSNTLAAVADAPFMSNAQKVETLFMATLSRRPRPDFS